MGRLFAVMKEILKILAVLADDKADTRSGSEYDFGE